ncbi:MAG: ligase-associated damage response endonuclease PdeM, partial [Bacteroidota bacterium]
MQYLPISFKEQRLVLSAERCLYWEDQSTLILSDMHVGKAAHFRKAGIAIPQQVFQEDLHRLFQQIHFFSPKRVIVTGDLFHSEANLEHDWFSKWRKELNGIQMVLVKGNHEILNNQLYEELGVEIIEKELFAAPFRFAHDLIDKGDQEYFLFSGHTHPGCKIAGKAKQSFVFPCFYFTPNYCILPAFSKFTG